MMGGEGEADGCGELADASADLEQAEPQGIELQAWQAEAGEPASEGVEQPVGGGMEQQAELVGPEAMATETIGEAGELEVADPLLGGAARDVEVVDGERVVGAGGDDEAGVGPCSNTSALQTTRRGRGQVLA